ncbi:helix-turn-helix transcriptional regulator [Deinococcus xianganensis]|uniref:WYL domain-containing protein n=1 Tax=Deinococcus xianganensis TaxID=1507289 RepID=A0A6I4YF10_9DEIO|nr:WYL domain-containing protein [Deinococcus xianganensis]MXV20112.1 WYL domain-containing protein [Deinococcus xianganensis]
MTPDEQSERVQSPVQRLFLLARLLRARPHTVAELAAATGQTLAVTARDLRELQSLEPGLRVQPGPPQGYVIGTPDLDDASRLTLLRGLDALAARGSEPAASLAPLRAALAAPLPAHVRAALPTTGTARPAASDLALNAVTQAWLACRPIRFQEWQPGKRRAARLHPLRIEAHPVSGDLLVVGRDPDHAGEVRTYRLGRMLHVTLEAGTFTPDRLDPAQTPALPVTPLPTEAVDSVTVTLRFTGEATFRVLEGGHACLGEPSINPDGSVDAPLLVPHDAGGVPRSVLPWLLSWGPQVQVLGPDAVRAEWQRLTREAAEVAALTPTRFVQHGAA